MSDEARVAKVLRHHYPTRSGPPPEIVAEDIVAALGPQLTAGEAKRIEQLATWIKRDRKESDKVLLYVNDLLCLIAKGGEPNG